LIAPQNAFAAGGRLDERGGVAAIGVEGARHPFGYSDGVANLLEHASPS
jgi:hypothetical protein